MKLTKEQRVFVAILGLAAGALAVDRFVLGGSFSGPAGASAGETQGAVDAAAELIVAPGERGALALSGDSRGIADRLNALRDQAAEPEMMASVLSVPTSWFDAQVPGQIPGQPAPAAVQAPEKSLQSKYHVSLVASGSPVAERNFVMINKKRYVIGNELDGMKLIELKGRQAIFEAGSEKVILEMGMPAKDNRPESETKDASAEADGQSTHR